MMGPSAVVHVEKRSAPRTDPRTEAADRSNRMRIDDLESAFAIRKASVIESSAVSVECPRLKPDWLVSRR